MFTLPVCIHNYPEWDYYSVINGGKRTRTRKPLAHNKRNKRDKTKAQRIARRVNRR